MQIRTYSAVAIVFAIGRICTADIIVNSIESYETFVVNEAAVDIISSCYGDRANAVGVISDDISENLIKTLSTHISLVFINDNSTNVYSRYRVHRRTFTHKLQVFIIEASSALDFYDSVRKIKRSIWWNHMASFLILHRSSRGCKKAQHFLLNAWKHDMMNTKFLCFQRGIGLLILGYNPYMNQAPKSWQTWGAYATYINFRESIFGVFGQKYKKSNEICRDLTSDATKNLNGYEIELLTDHSYNDGIKLKKSMYIRNYNKVIFVVIETFVDEINGTAVFTRGYYDGSRRVFRDMRFGVGPIERGLEDDISAPFTEFGLVAMTQHQGYKSQLEKIFSVVDIYTNIGVCIVIALTLIFLKFFIHQALMRAILNIVRIVCDSGFMNLPENTSTRLYITGVLIFAVTMQGIYQGNLASLLTTDVAIRNVRTWDDLMDLAQTIYVAKSNYRILEYATFKGPIVLIGDDDDCAHHVLRDPLAACVGFGTALTTQAVTLNLSLSERLKPTFGIFVIRPNWPLEIRLNTFIRRLVEGDLVKPYEFKKYRIALEDLVLDEDLEQNFRNMTLRDLVFAYVILVIGLVTACIAFIVEITIHSFHSRIWTSPVRYI